MDTGDLGQINNLFLHNNPIFEVYILHKRLNHVLQKYIQFWSVFKSENDLKKQILLDSITEGLEVAIYIKSPKREY